MTVRELFDFIVDPSIADESVDSYLDKVRIWIYFLSILMQICKPEKLKGSKFQETTIYMGSPHYSKWSHTMLFFLKKEK